MVEEYEIKITGSGTRKELIKALQQVVDDIKAANQINRIRWEDKILFTQIDEQ